MQINRIQFNTAFKTTLNDGTPVLIDILRPEDKDCIKQGFSALSLRSKRLRFIIPPKQLSEEHLKYLTEIDNVDHVAWGALDISKETLPGIGIARYIRSKENPASAEIGLTVIDEYQNRGLGTFFLNLLIQTAKKNNVSSFTGFILDENTQMIHMLKKLKTRFTRIDESLMQITIPLDQQLLF